MCGQLELLQHDINSGYVLMLNDALTVVHPGSPTLSKLLLTYAHTLTVLSMNLLSDVCIVVVV